MKWNAGFLQEYIKSVSGLPGVHPPVERAPFPFVTISRQTGAGGHALAEAILKVMKAHDDEPLFRGWQILDQEICSKVLEDPQLKTSMESLLTERYRGEIEENLSQMVTGNSPQFEVYRKIAQIVRSFAAVGKVVIVGRAGCMLTREFPLGVH